MPTKRAQRRRIARLRRHRKSAEVIALARRGRILNLQRRLRESRANLQQAWTDLEVANQALHVEGDAHAVTASQLADASAALEASRTELQLTEAQLEVKRAHVLDLEAALAAGRGVSRETTAGVIRAALAWLVAGDAMEEQAGTVEEFVAAETALSAAVEAYKADLGAATPSVPLTVPALTETDAGLVVTGTNLEKAGGLIAAAIDVKLATVERTVAEHGSDQ